jgi:hypothetical protein
MHIARSTVLCYRKGIALGSPLSPIIGAFFLSELDEACAHLGCSTYGSWMILWCWPPPVATQESRQGGESGAGVPGISEISREDLYRAD